ncbi:hypothetical protein, partial [Brevundimonas sp.]|uniref:hypothetical protein n=1 Tax=Brevundimonas sp. TaxID=1871086 RepID=UPI002897E020
AQASVLAAAQAEAFAGDAGDWAAASEGSAVQAAASAGEGLTYRNQAVDARDGAIAASQSAGVSATSARLASNQTMPARLAERENFCGAVSGRPETINAFAFGTVVTDPVEGDVLRLDSVYNIQNRGWRKIEPGRSFRTTVRSKVVSNGSDTNRPQYGFRLLSSDGTSLVVTAGIATQVAADGWVEFSLERTAEQLWSLRPEAVYVRGFTRANRNDSNAASGAVTDMAFLRFEDVTESVSAANAAGVAQAASANASADAASAQISANLAAQVGGRSRRVSDGTIFTSNLGGSPAGAPDLTAGVVLNDYLENAVREVASAINIQTKGVLEIGTGRTFRVYARTRVMVDGPNNTTYPHFRVLDASYASIGLTGPSRPQAAADMWQTYSHELTSEQIKAAYPTAFYIRGAVRVNRAGTTTGSSGATTRVAELWLEDISELAPVAAQLAIVGGVAADAADRLASVRFSVTGGAGGAPFQIWGRAGPAGSMAGMVASELAMSNVVNGVVVPALKLIGGDAHFGGKIHAGVGKEIIIDPTLPAIITTMGNARMAEGKLPNDNLIYWFGPKQEVANMRKSNATEWRDASGRAYFAGGISAGQLQASQRTSDQSATVSAQTGRFGSLGGTITVSFSYAAEARVASTSYTPPFPASYEDISYSPTAQIRLYRSLNGGTFQLVGSFAAAGQSRSYGINGGDYFEEGQEVVCGGSATFVDPDLSTLDRQYRVEMTGRSFAWLNGAGNFRSQFLNVVCVEG